LPPQAILVSDWSIFKQELPVAAYLLMERDEMINVHRGPPIDASYQVLVQFGKAVSEKFF
jgi:hypothetical protein